MENKQLFIELSADIFSKLFKSFPILIDIFLEGDYPDFATEEKSDVFFETIKFYIDEEFIKCEKSVYGGFLGVRLTSKGFTVLNQELPSIAPLSSKLGIEIKNAIKTGKTELMNILVSEAIKLSMTFIPGA